MKSLKILLSLGFFIVCGVALFWLKDNDARLVRDTLKATKFRPSGLSVYEAAQKKFPGLTEAEWNRGWSLKSDDDGKSTLEIITWKAPSGETFSWYNTFAKGQTIRDIKLWKPSSDDGSQSLFKLATGYDLVKSVDDIAYNNRDNEAGLAKEIATESMKTGIREPMIFPWHVVDAHNNEVPGAIIVWAQDGNYERTFGLATVPWGDFTLSLAKWRFKLTLHNLAERESFEKVVAASLARYGDGPWRDAVHDAFELIKPKFPTTLGGSCPDPTCSGSTTMSMAAYGFPFFQEVNVSTKYNSGSTPETFYVEISFGLK